MYSVIFINLLELVVLYHIWNCLLMSNFNVYIFIMITDIFSLHYHLALWLITIPLLGFLVFPCKPSFFILNEKRDLSFNLDLPFLLSTCFYVILCVSSILTSPTWLYFVSIMSSAYFEWQTYLPIYLHKIVCEK